MHQHPLSIVDCAIPVEGNDVLPIILGADTIGVEEEFEIPLRLDILQRARNDSTSAFAFAVRIRARTDIENILGALLY